MSDALAGDDPRSLARVSMARATALLDSRAAHGGGRHRSRRAAGLSSGRSNGGASPAAAGRLADGRPRVAAVLPGGGARGAYEAGALSILLPALEARGEHVSLWCGTSVGAINAALYASLADEPAQRQAEHGLRRWREMRKGDVISPLVGPGLLLTLLRFLGEAVDLPGVRLASLLDASPLQDSLDRWIDWHGLDRNVRHGVVEAVCVVATALSWGGPVAFVQTRGRLPATVRSHRLRYVRARLSGEHVRASAAIPLLFSPVQVTTPKSAADHYVDGGTRLNSPIPPAIALGAERMIVIGFEPFTRTDEPSGPAGPPRMTDVAANVLDGLLVDGVANDLRRMAAINSFFVSAPGAGLSRSAHAYRTARGRLPYRKVGYALVAPERRGELGEIAERVFQRRYGGLRGLLAPDYPFVSRLLGGRTPRRGELLSFMLFDQAFTAELIDAGRRDARRWLERHPNVWCSDASHDFGIEAADSARMREQVAIEEWRELRRR